LRKASISILENEKGEISVEYKGQSLAYTIYEERPYQAEVIDSKQINDKINTLLSNKKHKPSKHHPWRSGCSAGK